MKLTEDNKRLGALLKCEPLTKEQIELDKVEHKRLTAELDVLKAER